jgi:hypothetical protein
MIPLEGLAQWNDLERVVRSQDGQIIVFIDLGTEKSRHNGGRTFDPRSKNYGGGIGRCAAVANLKLVPSLDDLKWADSLIASPPGPGKTPGPKGKWFYLDVQ